MAEDRRKAPDESDVCSLSESQQCRAMFQIYTNRVSVLCCLLGQAFEAVDSLSMSGNTKTWGATRSADSAA